MLAVSLVLGLDVSTTATKAVILDARGEVVASAAVELPVPDAASALERAGPGPVVERRRGCHPRRAVAASASAAHEVEAVGLAGQMHGLVAARRPRRGPASRDPVERPAHPGRVRSRSARFSAAIGSSRSPATTRFPASPRRSSSGFAAMSPTSGRGSHTSCCRRTSFACDSPAITPSTEPMAPGRSCSTSRSETGRARSSPRCDVPPAWLPPTYEGPEITGYVSEEAAAATGLRPGTRRGRGRRRSGRGRRRRRSCRAGDRLGLARNVGRRVHHHRPTDHRAGGAPPRALPLPSRDAGT